MENKPCMDIQYGIVGADDAAPLAHLMMQERISLAGRVDPVLYRAFLEDALGGRGPHIMVVKVCGRIVGWSIGVIDSRHYWISFLGRHPATGIKVLAGLFLQRYRNHKDASTLGRKSVASSGGHGEAVPTLQRYSAPGSVGWAGSFCPPETCTNLCPCVLDYWYGSDAPHNPHSSKSGASVSFASSSLSCSLNATNSGLLGSDRKIASR